MLVLIRQEFVILNKLKAIVLIMQVPIVHQERKQHGRQEHLT